MDRFDFSSQARDAMNAAVRIEIIDAVELACIVAGHGTAEGQIMSDILECAWAHRHEEYEGGSRHGAFVAYYDAWSIFFRRVSA